MRSLRPLLLGGLLAMAFAVPAFAQTSGSSTVPAAKSVYSACKGSTPAEQEKGHNAYVLGKDKYDNGKLDEAITFFKDAYERDCQNHDYLIIISRAYERQPNLPEAILALETYVARAKDAPDLDKHRANIESMKQRLKAMAATTPTTAPTPPPTTAPTPPPTTPQPPVQEHTVLPWIATGVGVAALGTGIVFLAVAQRPANCDKIVNGQKSCENYYDSGAINTSPDSNVKDPGTGKLIPCTVSPTLDGCSKSDLNKKRQSDAGTADGLKTAGPILIVAGGVLMVGGVVWHFLEPTGPKKESGLQDFRFAPVVTPGYGGMAMGARF